jgi:hypothetical protein
MAAFGAVVIAGALLVRFSGPLQVLVQTRPVVVMYALVGAYALSAASLVMVGFLLSYYRQVQNQ